MSSKRYLACHEATLRYRIKLIQDYISGMTDLYAYDEYRRNKNLCKVVP
ncbi:MAG: hypothetical protein ACSLEL_02555 [Candidatus Malihini olakiniferum]